MTQIDQNKLNAAGDIVKVVTVRIGQSGVVSPETAIAAAARMSGTMLFRSFGLDTSKMLPGSAVFSDMANESGPELIDTMAAALHQCGVALDRARLNLAVSQGAVPRLTVLETQELLDGDFELIRERYQLTLKDAAHACAVAAAWLVRDYAPLIGAEVGFNIAIYGVVEGSKTVPRPEVDS